MRIAFVIASVSRKAGGLFESVRRLAQSLQDTGRDDVEVFSAEDEFTSADSAAWEPLQPRTFPQWGPRQFGYAPRLGSMLREVKADILNVHGIWMYPSVPARQWSRRQDKPLIIHPHGMLDPWAVKHRRWKKVLAGLAYETAHLKRAACIRALCPAEAEAIRQYGLRNPVCVIPNGIDLPESTPTCPPPWAASLEPGRRVLLFLGRLHPKKGLPQLLRAWDLFKRQRPQAAADWAVAVAGWDQNGHEAELRRLAAELGLERDVWFVGPQFNDHKAACFANANAFILPSFSEGLPMAVLEAWAYGLPVVMTPPCNLPEGFEANAALQTTTEPDDIARGLLELTGLSDGQRCVMGQKGRDLVVQRFTWSRIASQMNAVYDWVLGGGAVPAHVCLN